MTGNLFHAAQLGLNGIDCPPTGDDIRACLAREIQVLPLEEPDYPDKWESERNTAWEDTTEEFPV